MNEPQGLEIVATLGPASWGLASALRDAGVTSFRINASHMSAEELGLRAEAVRREIPDLRLIVDLQGAKIRLGRFAERYVRPGDRIVFSCAGFESTYPIPHREVFEAFAAGDTLSCDDDRLQFRIESSAAESMEVTTLTGGMLRPRKGVNVLEHPVVLTDLCPDDLGCLRATAHLGAVSYAFSFMNDGREAQWIRSRAPGCPVIGKIERREAMDNIAAVARATDAVWICRGDLGAQVGPAIMARWISGIDPRAFPTHVFMAGQVMEHLSAHPEPTRSEVCHLFDMALRGYRGVVLSDETAIGADPVRAVAATRRLLAAFQTLPAC